MTKFLRLAAIVVGALTFLRVIALAFQSLDLGPDETQYWAWAQNPDFGYFSKPPFIAWLIAFTTHLAGDGEFGVRLAAPLLHGATALLLYAVGEKLYEGRIALWSAITYATLPAVAFSSTLISTDAPLLFFWALSLYLLIDALDKPTLRRALGLGAAIGFGMLAKYAMAYFVLCALIAAITIPGVRRLIFSLFGLVTLGVALLVLAPNVAWNAARGFPTVAHTAANANFSGSLFHPDRLAGFLGSQFGVFGPILFASLLILAVIILRERHRRIEPDRLLLCFSLPVLLIACGVALLSRANANWAAPAFVAATPLVVHALLASGRRIVFAASLGLHGIAALAVPLAIVHPAFADRAGFSNGLKRVRGWTELGHRLLLKAGEAPYTAILADDRELMGELLYYIRPRTIPVVMWDFERAPRSQYELSNRIDSRTGVRVLFVSLTPDPVEVLQRFERTEPLGPMTVRLDPTHMRTVYLFDLAVLKPRRELAGWAADPLG